MDHIRDRADTIDRIEQEDRLRTVRHRDRDAVVFSDTDRTQGTRALVDLFDHPAESRGSAHEIESDGSRIFLGHLDTLMAI